jgi:hypothetical protein
VIGIRGLRGAVVTVAAVIALAGCGAVTSEEHKLESTAKHKVESEAQGVGKTITRVHLKYSCHPSPTHVESVMKQLAKHDRNKFPSPAAIERAVCR